MKIEHSDSSGTKTCSSLALELEGSQNLHTTKNCGHLRFLENALVVSELVRSSSCIFIFKWSSLYSSNNLFVEEDPLHLTDERCSDVEDRCVKRFLQS